MVNQVDGAGFAASALPGGRVAVMFSADWCGFSRQFYKHFKAIQEGWVVDISDEDVPAWDAFGIEVVPTVVVFENGAPTKRWAGVLRERHVDEIREALSPSGAPAA